MTGRLVVANGTEADWESSPTPLALGEIGYATDTQTLKVGNGNDLWVNLQAYGLSFNQGAQIDDSQADIADTGVTTTVLSSQGSHSLANQVLSAAKAYADQLVQGLVASVTYVYQNSDGTWASRPNVTTVVAIGYPGLNTPPTWMTYQDEYKIRERLMATARELEAWLGLDGNIHTYLGDTIVPPAPIPPPTARITTVSQKNLGITLSGSTSSPVAPATITGYAWDFGDGGAGTTNAVGQNATHYYVAPGTYTVKLTVTDSVGRTGFTTYQAVITVAHTAPTVSFSSFSTTGLVLQAGVTVTAGDSAVQSTTWDFGDGSSGSGSSITHTYSQPGNYTVQVVATDANGLTGTASQAATAVVPNNPPTASFTTMQNNMTTLVDGSASTDSDGTIASYDWDWGDGTTHGSGKTASHTYAALGPWPITLTVTDNQGAQGTINHTVTPQQAAGTFTLGQTKPVSSNTGAGVVRPLPTTSNTTTSAGGTLNSSGVTYTGLHFTSDVTVASPNITLNDCIFDGVITFKSSGGRASNCIVTGGPGKTGNQWLIKTTAGTGTYIEFCTLHPSNPYDGMNGIGERNYTAYRCEIYNTVDGFSSYPASAGQSTNVVEQGCYVHDLCQFAPDTQNNNRAQTHNDCHQTQGGDGTQIVGNNHEARNATGFGTVQYNPQINMSCVMMNHNIGNLTNLVVTDNWFDYGIIAVNGTGLGAGDSCTVKRNRFGPNASKTANRRSQGYAKASAYTMPLTGPDINYNTSDGSLADYYLV